MVLNSPFSNYVLLIVFSACTSFVCSQTERFSVEEKVRWDVEKADSLATETPEYLSKLCDCIDTCIEDNRLDGLVEKIELALAINKKLDSGTNPVVAVTLLNKLGIVYLNLADYDRVAQITRQALDLLSLASNSSGSDSFASDSLTAMKVKVLNTLGMAYLEQKHFDKALATFRMALSEMRENNLLDDNLSLAITNNICSALFEDTSKDISTMEKELLAIVGVYKENFSPYSILYLSARNNLASFYMAMDQYDKALGLYEEVIKDFHDGNGTMNWQYVNTAWNYALTLYLAKRRDDALLWHKKCLEVIKELASRDFLFLSEQEREKYWRAHNHRLKHFLNFAILNYFDDEDKRYTAFAYDCELFAKNLLLSSAVAKQNAIYRSGNRELRAMWQQMKTLRNVSRDKESYELERKLINALKKEGISDEFSSDWQTIRQMLEPDEAAIEIINFPVEISKGEPEIYYFALIVRAGTEYPELIILGKEEWMYTILAESEETIGPLYNLIWESIVPYLTDIVTLYVAPSGLFSTISFAAFKNPDGSYIAGKYTIHNLLSTRDIAILKERKEKTSGKKDVVLFGGADFGLSASMLEASDNVDTAEESRSSLVRGTVDDLLNRRGQGFDFLPGSLAEVQAIEKITSAAKWKTSLFTDTKATETRLKSYSGNSSKVLHISTHGFYFSPPDKDSLLDVRRVQGNSFSKAVEPMMRSGLLLSGANNIWTGRTPADISNDGVLTAYEIANLDFSNTELVVLSACDTGLGDIDYSEGIYGLQRAFRLAGVRSMIISLWKVPDEETTALMTAFYIAWTSGLPMKQAFEKAQMDLRKRYPEEPYKWGGFVLIE